MRAFAAVSVALLMMLVTSCAEGATTPEASPPAPQPEASANRPATPGVLRLPNGFAPEGIAIDSDGVAYLGDRENGAIYRLDLATGQGRLLSPPTGRGVQGLKVADGRLYAAGRTAGDARVIDTRTGRVLASLPLVTQPTEDNTLVNDVLLTPGAWWLTESRNAVLYRITLPANGALPTRSDVRAIPLGGEFRAERGINANGITTTPDGAALLIVQSKTGKLFRVDPNTGYATTVDLGGERLDDGDGLLRIGRTLYVAQNESNTLTTVELDQAGTRGRVLNRLTDPRFDAPTTIASWGDRLYLPNARFDEEPGPSTEYTVVSVPVPSSR